MQRNTSLDVIRVVAIFLVLWQHASEFYLIGPELALVDRHTTVLIAWFSSLDRTCVPLFAMLSGYLLLPTRLGMGDFYRKRLSRVLWPWLFWCVGYAVFFVFYRGDTWAQCLTHIANIPLNWGVEVGHLWYVYMLIGLYLLIPVLSPWVERATKRQFRMVLGLWWITTLLPYIHLFQANVWGECSWNVSPMLAPFTGFTSFLLLGAYVRRFGAPRLGNALALTLVGYVGSALALILTYDHLAKDVNDLELPWNFCSTFIAMATLGLWGLLSRVKVKEHKWLTDLSNATYAIYLIHIMLMLLLHDHLTPAAIPVWAAIPYLAVLTLIATYLVVKLLSLLPVRRHWLGV